MIDLLERERLAHQTETDAKKTQAERNKLGQFATPPILAKQVVQCALDYLEDEKIRFLDPALGTGAFFSALLRSASKRNIASAIGYEIDPLYATTAQQLWAA